jgi:hypothetical protein
MNIVPGIYRAGNSYPQDVVFFNAKGVENVNVIIEGQQTIRGIISGSLENSLTKCQTCR